MFPFVFFESGFTSNQYTSSSPAPVSSTYFATSPLWPCRLRKYTLYRITRLHPPIQALLFCITLSRPRFLFIFYINIRYPCITHVRNVIYESSLHVYRTKTRTQIRVYYLYMIAHIRSVAYDQTPRRLSGPHSICMHAGLLPPIWCFTISCLEAFYFFFRVRKL